MPVPHLQGRGIVPVMRLALALGLLSATEAFRPPQKFLLDAEKKHARVALLALPTLVALGASGIDTPTSWLASQAASTQLEFFAGAGAVEAACSLPRFKERFELRDNVEPGRFFGLGPGSDELNAAEDLAGRAAMMATIAYMATDLIK